MLRVCLLYAVSGFVSLGYQVAWFRIFTDWFGSTNLTFALVVCNFIGGLGVGALLSQRLAGGVGRLAGISDRLRLYGLLEIGVSLGALLTLAAALLPPDLWGSFPYRLVDGVYVQEWGYRFGQVAIAAVCVFIPCLLMGVTFPLLCHTFVAEPGGARFPAALYAWNTLGACTGVMACQFLLLPWIGHGLTFQLMAGVNLAIGAYFLLAGGAPAAARVAAVPAGADPARHPGPAAGAPAVRPASVAAAPAANQQAAAMPSAAQAGAVTPPSVAKAAAASAAMRAGGKGKKKSSRPGPPPQARDEQPAPALLITIAALSGLLAGALEGDMFKRISFVVAGNPGALMPFISFWAIVGIFLGSVIVHRWQQLRLWHLKLAVTASALLYYVAWRTMYPLSAALDAAQARTEEAIAFTGAPMFPSGLFELWWFTGLLVLAPFLLLSLLLPWACNRLQASRRHLGLAYGLNTVAFCAGLLAFTLFAPMVSIFFSLKLMLVLLACGVALMLLLSDQRPYTGWQPAAAAALFAGGALLVPTGFDAAYMRPGTDPTRLPVEYVMSDGANTTLVVRKTGDDRLYFGNMSMSGTNLLAQSYMRLMAHVPLLAQENPERALLICFGVGNTASAIAAHDSIRQLDIVDLNRNVFATAPAFSATHGNVHEDPRVRLINDDGRNYLKLTDQQYDLVTSEPPPPMAAGVYRLYSTEYYRDIRDRLTPTGTMSQWLPVYQMPMEAVELAIASFIEVFPDAVLYVGIQHELLLIGGRGELDLERIHRRFGESARVLADLRGIGVVSPGFMLARIMMGSDELQQRWAGARRLSDQHNQLDQLFLRPDNLALLPYDPLAVAGWLDSRAPEIAAELRPVITHLGRLRYRVDSFPLQRVRQDPAIALSDLDWLRVSLLQRTAARRQAAGDVPGAIQAIAGALELNREQPALLSWIGERLQASGRAPESLPYLETLARVEPDDASANWRLATAYYATGQAAAGIPHLERAVALSPDWVSPHNNLAWIYAAHPDPGVRNSRRALELAGRAADLSAGADAGILYTLGAAQAAAGQFDQAVRTATRAITLAEAAGNPPLAGALREHLLLYQDQQALIDPRM